MSLRSMDPGFEVVSVDGQELLIPSDALVASLVKENALDGRPVGAGRLFGQFASLATAVDGLRVALGAVREPGKPWWVYHVIRSPDAWVRVHMESIRCGACGFRGLGGNPREFALYIGTENPLEAMLSHEGDAKAPCPDCGAVLDRPCVFAAALPAG